MQLKTYLERFSAIFAVPLIGALLSVESFAQMSPKQTQLLINNCVQCHAEPRIKAPLMGNADSWSEIIAKGEEKVLANVINGMGNMPPLGYCSACDEQDFRVLIRTLAGLSTDRPINEPADGEQQ